MPENTTPFHDVYLGQQVAQLVGSVAHGTVFLFTSRVDFDPLERGRMSETIGHIGLGELSFPVAVQLMNRRPSLAPLPLQAQEGVLSKRWLYAQLGGYPWALNQFAIQVANTSLQAARQAIAGVRRDLLAFTLVERAIAAQTERARRLLRDAAVYDQPVPPEGLAFLLGDETDCMPDVSAELPALLGWGLLAREPDDETYALPTLVRDWTRARLSQDDLNALRRRAAQFWLGVGRDSESLVPYLHAREYLFAAGDYERADDIVNTATKYLLRWGQVELIFRLLSESVRTLSGQRLATALHNLGIVYQGLGDYAAAGQRYEQSLAIKQALGDQADIATSLHQLGVLHSLQGDYTAAHKRFEQALVVRSQSLLT